MAPLARSERKARRQQRQMERRAVREQRQRAALAAVALRGRGAKSANTEELGSGEAYLTSSM